MGIISALRDAVMRRITVYAAGYAEALTGPDFGRGTSTSYESVIGALYRQYSGIDTRGSGLVREIVDFRAAQIAGNGINVRSDDPATNEWLTRWAAYNQISGRRGLAWVRDSELEGRAVLINTVTRDDDGNVQIRTRSLPWIRWQYTILTDPEDGEEFRAVSFSDASGRAVEIDRNNATYIKTAGATAEQSGYCMHTTIPRTGLVLDRINAIAAAMDDLRGNNRLYGRPVRVLTAQDEATANQIRLALFGDQARGTPNVRLDNSRGEFYVVAGSMSYAEPSGQANQSILREITMCAQIISGVTGVPVHYMGFPELLSNRATADDMHELINATTAREREAWKSGCREHAMKACRLYMQETGEQLQPDSIVVTLPVIMLSSIQRVADVWLPLYQAGVVSKQTVREQVPGIDPELERQADEAESARSVNESVQLADLITRNLSLQSGGDE
jgi:hypothetical protein